MILLNWFYFRLYGSGITFAFNSSSNSLINLVVNGFPDIALTAEQEIEGMMEENQEIQKNLC